MAMRSPGASTHAHRGFFFADRERLCITWGSSADAAGRLPRHADGALVGVTDLYQGANVRLRVRVP